MDARQFYPTPKALAERAWALFKNRTFTRVLEPSAGDGALRWSRSFGQSPGRNKLRPVPGIWF